jgi:hypothetical protein
MAILTANASNAYRFFDLDQEGTPPEGTFQATIIDIEDRFGVERKKFQSEETEKVDMTSFLFGFRDEDNSAWKIDSKPMKISGHKESALFKFLKSILGKAPEMGWDYLELKGRKVLLTIEHATSNNGNEYANIAAISPLPKGYDKAAAEDRAEKPKVKPAPAPVQQEDDDDIPF